MGSPEYPFYLFLYERTSRDQVTVFQEPRANGSFVISHFFAFFLQDFEVISFFYNRIRILVERGLK